MASHIRQLATICAIGVTLAGCAARGLEQMKQAADPASKQCIGAMERTLAEDPRYAAPPSPPLPADRLDEAIALFNDLTGERLACAQTIVRMHQRAIFESCTLHQCGRNVGGGCAQFADPVGPGAVIRAVEKCGI